MVSFPQTEKSGKPRNVPVSALGPKTYYIHHKKTWMDSKQQNISTWISSLSISKRSRIAGRQSNECWAQTVARKTLLSFPSFFTPMDSCVYNKKWQTSTIWCETYKKASTFNAMWTLSFSGFERLHRLILMVYSSCLRLPGKMLKRSAAYINMNTCKVGHLTLP